MEIDMDVVEKLRAFAKPGSVIAMSEIQEAADEIERLREVLKYIAYPECISDEAAKMWEMVKHARAALKGDE